MKKRDILLILFLLIAAGISYGLLRMTAHDGNQVIVTVDKEVVITASLDQNQELDIPLTNGSNKILIKNGEVSMIEADCPDQICVKHKSISKSGETIVCLPHKVIVEIKSDEESDVDIMTERSTHDPSRFTHTYQIFGWLLLS
jgi:hypothetical protein